MPLQTFKDTLSLEDLKRNVSLRLFRMLSSDQLCIDFILTFKSYRAIISFIYKLLGEMPH